MLFQSALTISMSAVIAQFENRRVSPIKMQICCNKTHKKEKIYSLDIQRKNNLSQTFFCCLFFSYLHSTLLVAVVVYPDY